MKTLGIVGLGSMVGLCLLVGCSAERSIDDEIGDNGGPPGGAQTGDAPGKQIKLNLPLLDIEGTPIDRRTELIGSLTPGVSYHDTTGDTPPLPGGDGTSTTPPGDGTSTPPQGDGTSTTPPGDGTSTTPPSDTTVTPTPIETTPVIDIPLPVLQSVDGNPTCSDLFDVPVASLKVESLKDGTYSSAGDLFSVNIDFAKSTLDYKQATASLLGVIVKGGPHANVYRWSKTEATGLSTPAGEEISHVDFCYRD